MSTPAPSSQSIFDFARSLAPDWRFLADWLYWPPDVFALTSLVLTRTGCYRRVIAHHGEDECPGWEAHVETSADKWKSRLGALLGVGADASDTDAGDEGASIFPRQPDEDLRFLADCVRKVELKSHVTLERLSTLQPGDADAAHLADALLTLHALADEACQGLGFKPYGRRIDLNRATLPHCLGNLLLTSTGSLSVLPKHCGIVLPKLRTPQGGLSIRSFSHHVTFHESEVVVMWRSVPTANMDEDTLNLMLVPWPSTLDERSFVATRDQFEVVRYFGFSPAPDTHFERRLNALIELLRKEDTAVSRIHLLLFPECALNDDEFDVLLRRLRGLHEATPRDGDGRLKSLPLIIAGVREDNDPADHRRGMAHNEVRIASYFAGQWYVLSQRKHHRWKLDRDQIRMYGLEGRLPTARNWFEDITLAQRRLTFLAPAGWLTLCPLVCEDLARSDPVSEIVRGVGPALLSALLLDGPQLNVRWPARYAGVFADDPGTAVVTLTARGMVRRAGKMENDVRVVPPGDKQVVSLFKDQVKGAYELALEGKDEQVILLTLAATMKEEFTADGRGGHNVAPVFRYEGHRVCPLDLKDPPDAGTASNTAPPAAVGEKDPSAAGDEHPEFGDWFDIREMTAALYAIDAALRLDTVGVQRVLGWLTGSGGQHGSLSLPPRLRDVEVRLALAQRDPAAVGISARHPGWPSSTLRYAVANLRSFFSDAALPYRAGQVEDDLSRAEATARWEMLIDRARDRLARPPMDTAAEDGEPGSEIDAEMDSRLSDLERKRLDRAVPLAILCALHDRLSLWRVSPTSPPQPASAGEGSLTPSQAARLLARVEQLLAVHS